MRLDKGGVTTDPLLRSLVTLPTSSIGRPPPEEDDSGRRLDQKASWTEIIGRYLHQFGDELRLSGRGVWGWLRGVPLERQAKADADSGATQMSESPFSTQASTHVSESTRPSTQMSPFGSPGLSGWQRGSWLAEEPAIELSAARVPRSGAVSLSEERLERLLSEQGGWLPLTASQLVRTYPSPTRWWSSNNDPLVRARPRSHHLSRTHAPFPLHE